MVIARECRRVNSPYAVVAITKRGVDTARRLQRGLSGSDLYYPRKFARGDEEQSGVTLYEGTVAALMPNLFSRYQGIIGILSLGAMVRLIAPLLQDKKTDPGVVVVDDHALHAVSVLSGHVGGANQLTLLVAQVLGAQPVITTASDVGETLAVDIFGREFGFTMENSDKVTAVSAAVVNELRVHIVQEAGERNWWKYDRPLPSHLVVYDDVDSALTQAFDAAIVVTPRELETFETELLLANGVLYRPKVVTLGIGCNRGTHVDEIESVIRQVLNDLRLSIKSVHNLATIDVKANESGLLEVCQRHGWSLHAYSAAQLNQVTISQPSALVHQYVGAWGVCAPAARLASGATNWVLEKMKSGNVTLSVCLMGDVSGKLKRGWSK